MTVDTVLLQDEHRVADGTRPLEVGRPVPFLTPSLHEPPDAAPLDCFYAPRWHGCRRQIQPGEHYLLHIHLDGAGTQTGRSWSYCAPCAVHFGGDFWHVREVAT